MLGRLSIAVVLPACIFVGLSACDASKAGPDDDAASTTDAATPRDAAPPDAAGDPPDATPDGASTPPDASDPTSDGAPSPDAGPPPSVLDPSLFDCTSLGPDGTRLPERASPTLVACALDPSCTTPQVAAHRGAGGPVGVLAPEDSLAAYRAGIALGVEYVETDPRPTADGVIVNMHDAQVDRTTNGTGRVDELTFDQVRALELDSGSFAGDFRCERVPTLVEILETCRGRVVVLIDANKTDRVDLLVDAIHAADAVDWVVFDTSSTDKLEQALSLEPRLRVMPRPDDAAELEAAFDALEPILPVIVEVPPARVATLAPLIHQRGTRAFTDVLVHDLIVARSGDLDLYLDLFDQGAQILQSDRPDLVIRALESRGRSPRR